MLTNGRALPTLTDKAGKVYQLRAFTPRTWAGVEHRFRNLQPVGPASARDMAYIVAASLGLTVQQVAQQFAETEIDRAIRALASMPRREMSV